jgi:MFS family permease
MNEAITLEESRYISRPIKWYDYLTINFYFLGLTFLSQSNGLIFPILIQMFVGEASQGAYLGTLRLVTLMVALLMQAMMGLFSDRSTSRWGRRRPFIFSGTLLNAVFITLIGFSAGMSGMAGFWFLFSIAILSQVASNMASAANQGLIPDLVPENKRGRFSAVKAFFEVPIPLVLVPFTVGTLVSRGMIWEAILLAAGILIVTMLVTMLSPEKPLTQKPEPISWEPIGRLALMTALFTVIIVGMGQVVSLLGRLFINIQSPALLLAIMGTAGLMAMLVAIGIGVWYSVRISIGKEAAQRNPSFTWWVINRLAFLVGAFNLSTFAVYLIQVRYGFSGETAAGPASRLMMIVGLSILVSTLPSGWLADRFGRKRLLAIAGIAAAAGTGFALSIPNLTVLYAGGVLIGLATGLFFSANWALGTDLVPKDEAGRYLGISNLAGAGAGAVGAYIGGPIADYFTRALPQTPDYGYVLLFTIYGSLFLLSVFALPFISDTRRQQ